MAADTDTRYVPAAGWSSLTRFYDPVIALAMREGRFRGSLRDRVDEDLPLAGTALDIGCGTGTFAISLAASRPDATVMGVDGDPEILALARRKAGAGAVDWSEGLAGDLPVTPGSVDVVTMSLVLHHLLLEEKREALAAVREALKPGGRLHIADWGAPRDPVMSGAFLALQAIDGFDRTRDHRSGRLPRIIEEAGFSAVERYERLRTGFGSLELLRASSSDSILRP